MRLLPPANIPPRVFTVSVDLLTAAGSRSVSKPKEKDIQRLLQVFRQQGVVATWGLTEPAGLIAEQVMATDPQHEIAVATRTGDAVEAHNLTRDVIRRVERVASNAPVVATLVVRGPLPSGDNYLLARNGIRAIASNQFAVLKKQKNAVITVRYGLWHLPAAASIGGGKSSTGDWRTRRKIDRTMAAGGLFHLAVDGLAVVECGATLRQLERLLSHVAHQHRRGELTVRTLADVTESFVRHSSRSARSILRVHPTNVRAA